MTNINSPQPVLTSFVSTTVRSVLGYRFGMLAIVAGVIGLSAYSSWGWLVALGLAPLLISVAPCVAMCALGLCSMGMKSKTTAPTTKILSTDGKPSDHKNCC